eukprot:591965-Amphidinium_carterae.1
MHWRRCGALLEVGTPAARNEESARGVVPTAVLGHSVGEYTAAVVANSMQLEDIIRTKSFWVKQHESQLLANLFFLEASCAWFISRCAQHQVLSKLYVYSCRMIGMADLWV